MRIVEYIEHVDFAIGGPPRAVVDLVGVLHRRGHEVTLATTTTRDVPAAWMAGDGPEVLVLPKPSRPGGFFAQRQLGDLAEALEAADVLQLHGVWERTNVGVSNLARRLGVPWVVTLRGMLDDWNMTQRGFKKRMYLAAGGRRVLEDAAFVQCTAEGEREQSHKWFPRGTPRVIPNLMDLDDFTSLRGPALAHARWPMLAEEGPHLLFLSRLHVKKGIEHLLDAMPRLVEVYPNLQVFIVGPGEPGYVESLKQRSRDTGVEARTHFTGQVGGEEKWSLFESCDLFVLPSSQENFGFVQFEALACATPVMTTVLVDTWKEVVASGGGIAVEQSADAIVEALTPLLADREALAAMGAAGRAWMFEHMSVDHIAGQLEAMYHDAAGT
ncbi:MAG: glycosyltransferase [Phycisphaerales bacterium]|jgi:glycosyltransferase involved in cell wall biosynthesis|nr:glycosyltransferase [Phycisphaerales bacterium]